MLRIWVPSAGASVPVTSTLGIAVTVTIPQHSSTSTLNDIACFLRDIDLFFVVDEWEFEVEWCMCDETSELQQSEWARTRLSDESFRRAYRGTYQTIDGSFSIFSAGKCVAILKAVDSSFWEIASSQGFEEHMAYKYGKYKYNA